MCIVVTPSMNAAIDCSGSPLNDSIRYIRSRVIRLWSSGFPVGVGIYPRLDVSALSVE